MRLEHLLSGVGMTEEIRGRSKRDEVRISFLFRLVLTTCPCIINNEEIARYIRQSLDSPIAQLVRAPH